ncbi:HAMP domain-containing histidine kinase [Tissierella sp. MSJ-40]|uniref:histidine kinase n=1 Tax=Tissierella simiarum TaxID=2841534 RepID=A0ABS6E6F4_9FIRM|nr:HAMP domain-containing sensor histidine kinase [Tissierella simiarum]MBU5437813.1 HAMP domain-containing histidine kinase [Tissierella simiarum]
MKNREHKGIRWKIILLFILSIVASIITVFILLLFAFNSANYPIPRKILKGLDMTIGRAPIVVVTGLILFIMFFFIFTQKRIRYLEDINMVLKKIAQGNLEAKIPIESNDELGQLAENINFMAEQLKTSIEEERKAEKMKNELITNVSHDLRTPLTSIIGYLGLVANDNYKDELTLRYYVDIAYSKSLTLKKLIDELFEFTKISYGGIKLNLEKIDLGQLLEQLVEEFVPILNEAEMEYRLTSSKEKLFIEGDGSLLVRVFENLLSNAIRYGKEGKYVDINIKSEKDKAVISIINYGETISEMDLPYIFDRFYKVDKSRSQDREGTGLGLAIAKNIIELHGGEIAVYSKNGRTEFQVKL